MDPITHGAAKRNGRLAAAVKVVEAAGQPVPPLSRRAGLCLHPLQDAERVIRVRRILVPAHPLPGRRVYESLQGRPEVGPLPTPRRCHAAFSGGNRVRRCEPRFHSALSGRGDHADRTRVRKPSTVRTTCLAWLFELRLEPANRQADSRLAASTDPPGQAARPGREADENDAAPSFEGLAHQQASAASSRC